MKDSSNQVYVMFNGLGVAAAYLMMGVSLWLAPIDLALKGYWAMGIFMLTLSLVNLVKYRMDERNELDTKNEKIIQDFITEE